MRIAIFHELHEGGAKRIVYDIANFLKLRHKVDIYYVDSKKDINKEYFFESTYYFQFNSVQAKNKRLLKRVYSDTLELFFLYLLHKKIAYMINKKQYDCIFVHPSRFTQAPFILRFLKGNIVYYCQESLRLVYEKQLNFSTNNLLKKYYEKINRFIRKKIDNSNIHYAKKILVNSLFTQNQVFNNYNLSSRVSYLGVNCNIFFPIKKRKIIDVLYIGSKENQDGYSIVISLKKKLKSRLKVFEHITGKNFIASNKLRELYNSSKVTLCLTENEPFGLIPIESMACGVPVIALNCGGYKETILPNSTGFLLEKDISKILLAIFNILDNKQYKKISKNCVENVKTKWDWEKRIIELEKNLFNE